MSSEGTSACGCSCGTPKPLFDEPEEHGPWWKDTELMFPITAGVFCITAFILDHTVSPTTALVCYWVALIAGGWTFIPGSLRQLVTNKGRSRMGVGLLMTIAAVGAVLLGHVGEAAALAFLFSISETLEDRAMDRAQQGLRALLSLMPNTARVVRDDVETTVPASEVRASDVLVVGAGDRVATDGTVIAGQSWLDTSAITGESIPVGVSPGSNVSAGSVNGSGTLRIQATSDGRDNSLTQIVRLVEQAQSAKGERARFADRVARPLVPAVLVASLLIVLFGFLVGDPATWTQRALVVLVAASPCAMAIAVPVTVISAVGAASKLGVVIKSGVAFEQLGMIQTVAFDKTGTLTENNPRVVATHFVVDDALPMAAAVESASSHPLSQAIVAAAAKPSTNNTDVALTAHEVQEQPGQGLIGMVEGKRVRVGSPRWIPTDGASGLADRVAEMSQAGMSVVVVEVDGTPAGVLGIRDELRPEAAAAVQALADQGMRSVMLTGDQEVTAQAIAAQAGIPSDRVWAGQLPADKARVVAELVDKSPTAMIGDGINDAPALAAATVGIAMGVTGSDAAIESADVAFTGSDVRLIPVALAHARRGRRIMTGNIGLALAIIVVLFPLALFGVLGLAAVVLVHEVAEVIVIGNGLRAGRMPRQLTTLPEPTTAKPPQVITAQ
ncbi:heavy metal translocating P-type ATPase [Corynebacterium matruchotii]|uniref:Cadmium-exporting ATPase n=1 Tax=Corynebacterium matruchotii ATCC 33806 TaxID=566549 RepID=C0E3T1_9CORY|nr:cation-translocating P-type ATPase [Corynebacterium matruchotii]EEG26824.1 cadmium-exporting ATPase [Corynebacterium matruchotii ATCC 33806]